MGLLDRRVDEDDVGVGPPVVEEEEVVGNGVLVLPSKLEPFRPRRSVYMRWL